MRWSRWLFLPPALVSIGMLWRNWTIPSVTMDGVTYLQIARNVLGGKGLGWQALWATPLHSLLIAATSFVTGIRDLAVAAGIVSSLAGFGLVMAVYFLAAELFDRRNAMVAALLAAVFPHLITISFSTEGEITYTFFLTLAAALLCRAVNRGSLIFSALAGVSFSLAYLSRSEGFLVMLCILAALAASGGRRFFAGGMFRFAGTTILLFFLASLPYLVFLHQHYGKVVISPKASYVMTWMKSRVYHDNYKGEMGNDELWGLSPSGRLRWQEPKGLGDLVSYLLANPMKNAGVYLRNLSEEIPGRIPNNSGMERYPQVFPLYLTLAALLAAFVPWGERSAEKKAILLAPFAILLVLPVFTGGWWKYLVPYLPFLIVAAARGLWFIAELMVSRFPGGDSVRRGSLLVAVLVCLLVIRFQWAMHRGGAQPNAEVSARRTFAGESKKAGEWAVQRFGSGINYMVPWSRIVYYLDGYWTALPVAELNEVLTYARANRVQLLVLEMNDIPPEQPAISLPGLELVDMYRAEGYPYAVGFYRLL